MPYSTVKELLGYRMAIMAGEQQASDKGQPVFNGDGAPKMVPVWKFVFSEQRPDGSVDTVAFTLNEQGREDVLRALTGVQPASSLHLPDGIQL